MSKELEKAQGININHQYHSKELDFFTNALLNINDKKLLKHAYYELVDKHENIVQILLTSNICMVQSIAHRMNLNYRLVEFDETWEDLDKNLKKSEE